MAGARMHFLEILVLRSMTVIPMFVLGFSPAAVNAYIFVVYLYSTFVHANLNWRFGPLEWLVATPAFHHWHHTNDEHRDHNYAALLPVIDRLFGTHHLPNHWPPVYGVDEPVAPTFIGQMLDPLSAPAAGPRRADPQNAESL